MTPFFLSTLCILWILQLVSLATATDIDSCPEVDLSSTPPISVHDIHPSQIEVVATIGDSISAGVAAVNAITPTVSLKSFKQYRGLSWLSGADPEATSIFSYVKHYSPDVYGGSHGVRKLPICQETFFCLNTSSIFKVDVLNAAMPAATSNHFVNQINYLNEHMGANTPYAKKWKLVNVFLGSNDLSVACTIQYGVLNYAKNMRKGIKQMKDSFQNVIVNLVGLTHSERIVGMVDRKDPSYRKKFEKGAFDVQAYECFCCRVPKILPFIGKTLISAHVDLFNDALQGIADDYGPGGRFASDDFVVVYQPFGMDVDTLPVEALSNIDGYHPNVVAYEFFSKMLWNQYYRPKSEKLRQFPYKKDVELYCPTDKDRIRTN